MIAAAVKRPEGSRVKYFLPTPRKIKGNIGHNIARAFVRTYTFSEKFDLAQNRATDNSLAHKLEKMSDKSH